MFRFSGFTAKANNAINVAMSQAGLMGHTYIGSEHLLLGLLDENSGVAHTALTQKNVTFDRVRKSIAATVGQGERTSLTPDDFTPRCKKALEMSIIKARMLGQSAVGTEHILMVLAKESDSYGVKLLKEQGVDPDALVSGLAAAIACEAPESQAAGGTRRGAAKAPIRQPGPTRTHTLDKYSRDLTELAGLDRLDPLIGREEEVSRVIQILTRRTKNNPCLIGEAGVGKTAVVEGLASRIVSGDVPEALLGKRLVMLDLIAMVAGAKYRGDFEDRIKNVIEEVTQNQNIILFIDELHTIMGAGAAEGAIDAANILKPQLARGELQLIGATTIAEYRKHIEKDSALERRFQSILVEQPTEEGAVEILKGLRARYEDHHGLKIEDDALVAAVSLSTKYIPDRFLPDKAIDLVDEAAARLRMRRFSAPQDLSRLESRLQELRVEKETAIGTQDFELAASIRDREKTLRGQIRERRGSWQQQDKADPAQAEHSLRREDIAELVAVVTGIELTVLSQEKGEQLLHLEEQLHQRVVGQHKAVAAVASAIRRGRAGLKDPGRPVGSFIFLGPTGVGKTELCLALAECLYSGRDALIRLDMSEYMEKHAVAKLIGAPPGYVGFEEGGQLTERVRRKPYAVILFDEIEKAHPDVFNILLQILEDGALTDSQGRPVSFKNTVVILTSNAGARHITEPKSLGFSSASPESEGERIKRDVMAELKKLFRPELLNRVDEAVVFQKLTREETTQIARKMLAQLAARVRETGITLTFSDAAVERIAQEGFDDLYGARPLRRAVQHQIEDPLADKILSGEMGEGERVLCDYRDGFLFEKQHITTALLPAPRH